MFYKESKLDKKDLKIYGEIMRIYDEDDDTLGHKKIGPMLKISKNRARRIMQKTGITPRKRTAKYHYHGKTNFPPASNLANDEYYHDNYDTGIIFSDIFEFKLLDGTKIRGCFALLKQTKQILSLVFDYFMNADLVTSTIDNCEVLENNTKDNYLIFHNDQGKQYGAKVTRDLILKKNLLHSMSRPGTPTDNPQAERFVSTFKHAVVRRQSYHNFGEFLTQAKRWINFYNNLRPHESISNLTPNAYAKKYGWPVVSTISKLTVY